MNTVNVCIAVRKICGMLNVHCESPMDQRDSHTIHSMRDKTSLSSISGRRNVEAADRFISLLEEFKQIALMSLSINFLAVKIIVWREES